jgi:two-component system KDP operon response regulator KdpE
MTLRVLVVEDDRDIRTLMQSSLAVEGFEVFTAVSLSEARALLQHTPPEVVVLDLGLPDGDGLELVRPHSCSATRCPSWWCRPATRKRKEDPAAGRRRRRLPDQALHVGELLARIRVALRHRGTALAPAVTEHHLDDLHINLALRTVEVGGQAQHLTPTEFKLLARLVRSAGRVVTHRQLLADVWGAEFTEHTHYLRLYMGQLRAKIERDPAEPRHLLTETGVGLPTGG